MENKTETQKNEYKTLLLSTKIEGIEGLLNWLDTTDFYTSPGSNRYHGNFEGGLLDHSLKVYKIFKKLSDDFKQEILENDIIISALLHDICKVHMYKLVVKDKKNQETGKWLPTKQYEIHNLYPIGHGHKSVILASKFIKLTDFSIYAIIHHMGFPGSGDYGSQCDYNTVLEMQPKIILLHLADTLSAHLFEKTIK